MSLQPQPSEREPSLIDIEVLDLGPLYDQAVEHYLSLDPARAGWDQQRRRRLRIRTECRWGRASCPVRGGFLLNERGDGPRESLAEGAHAYVALYAEMVAGESDAGFFESRPFCVVDLDEAAAGSLRALGLVALEDFIRIRVPDMEEAYRTWLEVLALARSQAPAVRRRAHSRAPASSVNAPSS